MILGMRLDPAVTHTPQATVYIVHRDGNVHLRDGAGKLRAFRLDRIVTHDDARRWTAWLARQTLEGRDSKRHHPLMVPADELQHAHSRVYGEISAALEAVPRRPKGETMAEQVRSDLEVGMFVEVTTTHGGTFIGVIVGNQSVFEFLSRRNYEIGRAHWASSLKLLSERVAR